MTPTFARHALVTGQARLFTMGVRPLGDDPWLWPDDTLLADLALKARLFADHRDEVFAADPGSEAAQAEALEMVRRHGQEAVSDDETLPALWRAAQVVQEDLVLMLPEPRGWFLRAASLSFPSSWRLREKMGLRLDDVHAHVPGFGPETRNAGVMARMFDNLRPDTPVLRWNYSLNGDPALYHPHSEDSPRFANGVWLRTERQTLRKLPQTGAILFTIRILHERVNDTELACLLLAQIEGLSAEQREYKGLTGDYDDLIAKLRGML